VPDDCVICETPLEAARAHCVRCGFPTALTAAAIIGLGREDAPEGPSGAPPAEPAPDSENVDPEGEAISHFARELRRSLEMVRELGGEYTDVIGELRQAAILEAEGRRSETLSLLRNAQVTASTRTAELFDQRLKELEDRQAALVRQGVAPEVAQDSLRLRAEFSEAPLEVVVEHLAQADRTLTEIESEWVELRSMLRQIDQIRLAARKLGQEFPDTEEELGRVRAQLTHPSIGRREIESTIGGLAKILRFYHETLSPALQEELDRHADRLSRVSPQHPPGRRARQMHAEANRHLRGGRLAEASFRLFELRAAIDELGGAPPPSEGDAAETARAPERGDPRLSELLVQARELAGRIRGLPPDSPLTEAAARQIREATELLRQRKLEEAGRSLADLMRTLDAPRTAPGEERA
jgi:hypothetical protein